MEQINYYYSKKYENYFNIDPYDRSISYITKDDNIDRYAENLFFWINEENMLNGDLKISKNPSFEDLKHMFIRMSISDIREKIDEKFNNNEINEIMKKTNDKLGYVCFPVRKLSRQEIRKNNREKIKRSR